MKNNIINLNKYIRDKNEENKLNSLYLDLHKMLENIEYTNYEPYNDNSCISFNLMPYGYTPNVDSSSAKSALINAYYALIQDGRSDLAENISEIIKKL